MSDFYANPFISSLLQDGKVLAELLSNAKSQSNKQDNVKNAVESLLKKLENQELPSWCPKDTIIPKVYEKLIAFLHKFIKLDPENVLTYQDLINSVNECKSRKESANQNSYQSHSPDEGHESSTRNDSRQNEASTSEIDQPRNEIKNLSDNEKQCLMCFCLFSAGKEVKKREAIHLWVGMDLIEDPFQGAEMLAKLVAEEFIERTIGNRKLSNRYKMNPNVRTSVSRSMVPIEHESLSIIALQKQEQQQQQHPPSVRQRTLERRLSNLSNFTRENQDEKNVLVLNISESILVNSKTYEKLTKRKNEVKVLHLGRWDYSSKSRYIIDTLKSLIRHMWKVTFLSLQGISGIVEFPDSVYKLENLKVLDLRACPNLETLPKGIEALKHHLRYLDLSECYLLDHIPKEIEFLTELRVLKGFVINPDDPQKENEKEKIVSASFEDLSKLEKLIKLTIRTRRRNFPTSEDMEILSSLKELASLRIAWVWSSIHSEGEGASGRLPKSLKKLELQAAPENTLSRLLRLISEDSENGLERLYIRGGRVSDLGMEMHQFNKVHTVRLKYLPELHMDWDEFMLYFPKLTRLEILGCSNLIFFPCDENGVWEDTGNTQAYRTEENFS